MSHVFLLVSTGAGTGLTTVSLGMIRALDRLGIRAGFFKPIAQLHDSDHGPEHSTQLFEHMTNIKAPKPVSLRRATSLLGSGREGLLMEEVIALFSQCTRHTDVVVVEGLVADAHAGYATRLNTAIARALDAEVILVGKPEADLEEYIDIAANAFGGDNGTALIGTILNKVGIPVDEKPCLQADSLQTGTDELENLIPKKISQKMAEKPFHFIGAIPWQASLVAPRMSDVADYLEAEILHAGDMQQRRVQCIEVCARTLANTLSVYQPNTLLIFPGDREDIFVAACMSAMNGVRIAGILLTGSLKPSFGVMNLCEQSIQTGIPVLLVESSSFQTAAKLIHMPSEVAADDYELIDQAMDHVANHLDADWLRARCATERKPRLSPSAFRYQLIQQASQAIRRIVLPEGDEPRTVMAAYQCQQRRIAQCILLGNPEKIHQVAKQMLIV